MVAEAIAVVTTAPYAGYAAIGAACHNIQNIACIDHTKQYFVSKSIQLWLDISAIIALIFIYVIGVGDITDMVMVICMHGDMLLVLVLPMPMMMP